MILSALNLRLSVFSKFYLTMTVILFLTFPSCKKGGEKSPSTGIISGTVFSKDHLPLAGVKVSIDDRERSFVYSDAEGKYTFRSIAVGDYSVLAAKEKYLSESKRATVTKDITTRIDFQLGVGEVTLEIEGEAYDFSYDRFTNIINVKSNAAWIVTPSADWLRVDNAIGLGDNSFIISADENKGDEVRVATLTLAAGKVVKVISITQYPRIKLLEVSMTNPISDTVVLTFSTVVEEIQLASKYGLCLGNLDYNKQPLSKEVRFKYSCGRLGQSYPFQLTVKSKYGTYSQDFDVDFFSKRIKYPVVGSQISPSYFVTDDNKTIWFSVFDSQSVQKIDMETFAVVGSYPVNFKVRKLVYNPYNKLIYILTNTPEMYLMDPNDGSITKQITLEVLEGDNKFYPTIYPQTLAFTSSGIGAMVCGSYVSSATSWKMIDSRKNDLVYYHAQKDKNYEYGKIEVNYNRTKLLIKASFSNLLFSFDPVQDVIRDITLPVHGALGAVVPNKKNENLYFIQTKEQYIYNPINHYLSSITYMASGNVADFSYRNGEEEIIYAFRDTWLQVLDYRKQRTLIEFPTIGEFYHGKPISTTDGKYLIAFANYTLYRFDTALLSVRN